MAEKTKSEKPAGNGRALYFPEQCYKCISCGKCCKVWDIPVTAAEKERIENLDLPGFNPEGRKLFIKIPKTKLFATAKNGDQCVFLDQDNLCVIHRHAGEAAKPLTCRLYPLDIHNWEDGKISAMLRFDCPAVARGVGRELREMEPEILSLARELSKSEVLAGAVYNSAIEPGLRRLRIIASAYKKFMLSEDIPPLVRFFAATRMLEFHQEIENYSYITEAEEDFIDEAYDFVLRSIDDLTEAITYAPLPNISSRVTFRYLLSGFARVDEEVAESSRFFLFARVSRSWSIFKFILGSGSLHEFNKKLPDTRGVDPVAAMAGVKFPKPVPNIYRQFLAARLDSMHFCGNPCFKLSFVEGMRHLIMTYPVFLAFSGMLAISAGRTEADSSDMAAAIEIIDRTFSRSRFFALRHIRNMLRKMCDFRIFPGFLNLLKLGQAQITER